jgi:hypothetical protein
MEAREYFATFESGPLGLVLQRMFGHTVVARLQCLDSGEAGAAAARGVTVGSVALEVVGVSDPGDEGACSRVFDALSRAKRPVRVLFLRPQQLLRPVRTAMPLTIWRGAAQLQGGSPRVALLDGMAAMAVVEDRANGTHRLELQWAAAPGAALSVVKDLSEGEHEEGDKRKFVRVGVRATLPGDSSSSPSFATGTAPSSAEQVLRLVEALAPHTAVHPVQIELPTRRQRLDFERALCCGVFCDEVALQAEGYGGPRVVVTGHLEVWRSGMGGGRWKPFRFVLKSDGALQWFLLDSTALPAGVVRRPVGGMRVSQARVVRGKHSSPLASIPPSVSEDPLTFVLRTLEPDQTLVVRAPSASMAKIWIAAITRDIVSARGARLPTSRGEPEEAEQLIDVATFLWQERRRSSPSGVARAIPPHGVEGSPFLFPSAEDDSLPHGSAATARSRGASEAWSTTTPRVRGSRDIGDVFLERFRWLPLAPSHRVLRLRNGGMAPPWFAPQTEQELRERWPGRYATSSYSSIEQSSRVMSQYLADAPAATRLYSPELIGCVRWSVLRQLRGFRERPRMLFSNPARAFSLLVRAAHDVDECVQSPDWRKGAATAPVRDAACLVRGGRAVGVGLARPQSNRAQVLRRAASLAAGMQTAFVRHSSTTQADCCVGLLRSTGEGLWTGVRLVGSLLAFLGLLLLCGVCWPLMQLHPMLHSAVGPLFLMARHEGTKAAYPLVDFARSSLLKLTAWLSRSLTQPFSALEAADKELLQRIQNGIDGGTRTSWDVFSDTDEEHDARLVTDGDGGEVSTTGVLRRHHFVLFVSRFLPVLADSYSAGVVFDALTEENDLATFSMPPNILLSTDEDRARIAGGVPEPDPASRDLDPHHWWHSSSTVERDYPAPRRWSHAWKTAAPISKSLPSDPLIGVTPEAAVSREKVLSYDEFRMYVAHLGKIVTTSRPKWEALSDSLDLDPREVLIRSEDYCNVVLSVKCRAPVFTANVGSSADIRRSLRPLRTFHRSEQLEGSPSRPRDRSDSVASASGGRALAPGSAREFHQLLESHRVYAIVSPLPAGGYGLVGRAPVISRSEAVSMTKDSLDMWSHPAFFGKALWEWVREQDRIRVKFRRIRRKSELLRQGQSNHSNRRGWGIYTDTDANSGIETLYGGQLPVQDKETQQPRVTEDASDSDESSSRPARWSSVGADQSPSLAAASAVGGSSSALNEQDQVLVREFDIVQRAEVEEQLQAASTPAREDLVKASALSSFVGETLLQTGHGFARLSGTLFVTNRALYLASSSEVLIIPVHGIRGGVEYCETPAHVLGVGAGRVDNGLHISSCSVSHVSLNLTDIADSQRLSPAGALLSAAREVVEPSDRPEAIVLPQLASVASEASRPRLSSSLAVPGLYLPPGMDSPRSPAAATAASTVVATDPKVRVVPCRIVAPGSVSLSVTLVFSRVKDLIVSRGEERNGGRRRVIREVIDELIAASRWNNGFLSSLSSVPSFLLPAIQQASLLTPPQSAAEPSEPLFPGTPSLMSLLSSVSLDSVRESLAWKHRDAQALLHRLSLFAAINSHRTRAIFKMTGRCTSSVLHCQNAADLAKSDPMTLSSLWGGFMTDLSAAMECCWASEGPEDMSPRSWIVSPSISAAAALLARAPATATLRDVQLREVDLHEPCEPEASLHVDWDSVPVAAQLDLSLVEKLVLCSEDGTLFPRFHTGAHAAMQQAVLHALAQMRIEVGGSSARQGALAVIGLLQEEHPAWLTHVSAFVSRDRHIARRRHEATTTFTLERFRTEWSTMISLVFTPVLLVRNLLLYLLAWESPVLSGAVMVFLLGLCWFDLLDYLVPMSLVLFALAVAAWSQLTQEWQERVFGGLIQRRQGSAERVGILGSLRIFALSMGTAQFRINRLNLALTKVVSLLTWQDPARTAFLLVALVFTGLFLAVVPARWWFAALVLSQFSRPIRDETPGLFLVALNRFIDGIPTPSASSSFDLPNVTSAHEAESSPAPVLSVSFPKAGVFVQSVASSS